MRKEKEGKTDKEHEQSADDKQISEGAWIASPVVLAIFAVFNGFPGNEFLFGVIEVFPDTKDGKAC